MKVPPQPDNSIVRKESVRESDKYDPISVEQYDELQQGPSGVWFPKRCRRGWVAECGGELDNTFRGPGVLNTRLWVAEINFLDNPK